MVSTQSFFFFFFFFFEPKNSLQLAVRKQLSFGSRERKSNGLQPSSNDGGAIQLGPATVSTHSDSLANVLREIEGFVEGLNHLVHVAVYILAIYGKDIRALDDASVGFVVISHMGALRTPCTLR
eukprot:gnl/Hemi2/902_TR320_c0_g7_i1.p1 gnl/Hemi2/902_TR320_c0_g7~~gnl/Hemi2/902_TR320_c0_g7_i1.p1  ORF type:complete len:124 (-),score=19.98 gnl/Hemi2/902_TR320_c0_g7_i1:3-374(-)